METRHEGFEKIGDSMKTIADAMKAGKGLTPEVAAAANKINEMAPQLKDWFPVGSGPETKRKTRAKAGIWQKPDEFVLKRERSEERRVGKGWVRRGRSRWSP